MKKMLISKEKNFYKANLHCHSTVSDGSKTPAELKEMYMQRGYSIIAYTDHDILISHQDLTDEKFLARMVLKWKLMREMMRMQTSHF